MYRDVVEPEYTWRNFTIAEQSKVVLADRSNCELDVGRLMGKVDQYRKEGLDVEVRPIKEAYRRCFARMKEADEAGGGALRA